MNTILLLVAVACFAYAAGRRSGRADGRLTGRAEVLRELAIDRGWIQVFHPLTDRQAREIKQQWIAEHGGARR